MRVFTIGAAAAGTRVGKVLVAVGEGVAVAVGVFVIVDVLVAVGSGVPVGAGVPVGPDVAVGVAVGGVPVGIAVARSLDSPATPAVTMNGPDPVPTTAPRCPVAWIANASGIDTPGLLTWAQVTALAAVVTGLTVVRQTEDLPIPSFDATISHNPPSAP